jgi:hypothetical protein
MKQVSKYDRKALPGPGTAAASREELQDEMNAKEVKLLITIPQQLCHPCFRDPFPSPQLPFSFCGRPALLGPLRITQWTAFRLQISAALLGLISA